MKLYLRILDKLFRLAWCHIPWFADYAIEYVHQVDRLVHGKLMQPNFIQQAREMLENSEDNSE